MANVAEANYDVPHCKFERTDDGGFIVRYQGWSALATLLLPFAFIGALIIAIIAAANGGGFIGFIVFLGGAGYGAFKLVKMLVPPTEIQVTPEFVIINNKKMRREDFGHFNQFGSQTVQTGKQTTTLHSLGYQFGSQSFQIRGAWSNERQISEVASSLNSHLQRAPQRGDEMRASPEALRAARPTDF